MIAFDSRKNLFEVNNARTQSIEEVVLTFSPPDSFWRLLSAKNHILLGSRGSGKTAVVRMLAHDHLSRFDHAWAKDLIERKTFIGTYVPMRAEWIGTLRNKPWQNEVEKERWFQWRLNLSSCRAFLDTASSCLNRYLPDEVGRLQAEARFCRALSSSWVGAEVPTFKAIRHLLEDAEWNRQIQAVGGVADGNDDGKITTAFDSELFSPLGRALDLLKREIDFPDSAVWCLCLDEIEFLDAMHHRILNSHLRSSGRFSFKLTTMPYFHHTLETNTAAPLVPEDDFDYVYLDFDPQIRGTDKEGWVAWGEAIIGKRISFSGLDSRPFSFQLIFGEKTPLLDEKTSEWTRDSLMMALLKKNTAPQLFRKALELHGSRQFKDQVSRKLHGALLLRDAEQNRRGHREHELYSGPAMVARCSDANPRQLIRLFNELTFRNPTQDSRGTTKLIGRPNAKQQTKVLIEYSREALRFVESEEATGQRLMKFMEMLCDYFKHRFYSEPLGTDYYYAISVDVDVSEGDWDLIRFAVGLGLLFPKVGFKKPELLPVRSGDFNLAYRLAPAYGLLPRQGKAVKLRHILSWSKLARRSVQSPLFGDSLDLQ